MNCISLHLLWAERLTYYTKGDYRQEINAQGISDLFSQYKVILKIVILLIPLKKNYPYFTQH